MVRNRNIFDIPPVTYHYAVWKTAPTMWPACWSLGEPPKLDEKDYSNGRFMHGITIVRGDVNCETCLRMMGPGEQERRFFDQVVEVLELVDEANRKEGRSDTIG